MIRRRRRSPTCWLAVLAAACSAPEPRLYDPGELSEQQEQVLVAAVTALRDGEPYDELRAQIAADPTMAFKFTRVLVLELNSQRDARVAQTEQWQARYDEALRTATARGEPAPDIDLFRGALGVENPVEQRALRAIDQLGAAAVPCLVEDLAKHRQAWFRQLGVELLGRLGSAALDGVDELATSGEPTWRRTAAQALGAMGPEVDTRSRLLPLVDDADYGVRAEALKALPVDGRSGALLRERLVADEDPFVRRSAATALARHRDHATAQALIDYLERCKAERDSRGADAAQDALQALARKRGVRSAEAWRRWAASWQPGASGSAGGPDGRVPEGRGQPAEATSQPAGRGR